MMQKARDYFFQMFALLTILMTGVGMCTLYAEEADVLIAEPQWIQTKGPAGVSRPRLFLTSDRILYAVAKTGLYRLTEAADAWTLVSTSGADRQFEPIMAEWGDTLYLVTPNELLASTDRGETWDAFGARPEGPAIALIITDAPQQENPQRAPMTVYLVLRTEVFRSEDGGKQWVPIGEILRAYIVPNEANSDFRIWDALAIDNSLFVGTSQGLFQLTGSSEWEKLPVPTHQGIFSLAAAEDRLYVGTFAGTRRMPNWSPTVAVFYSTDFGDFWTDITPNTREHPVKMIAAVRVVPIGDTLLLVGSGGALLSYDGGETWMDPGRDRHASGATPVVALDENNFYKTDHARITRSTDGGITWHPFMSGLGNSHVPRLVTVENVLYALTSTEMLKSADGGESWESVGLNADENASLTAASTKVATAKGVLYASNSKLDGVTLFRLSDGGDVLLPVEDVPDFEEDTLHTEWWKKRMEARKNNLNVDKVLQVDKMLQQWKIEEWSTNGNFTFTDETFFMEYKHKLFRWRRGETAWHDTGLEDSGYLYLPGESPKGLTLAISGNTVYAGKREGDLFQSLDNGNTWNDITATLAFPFGYFKEIVFAGSTVYVSTDMGVMNSRDGDTWHVLTDAEGNRLIMDRVTVDSITAYGVCNRGVYQVDTSTNTWKQISPEIPHAATSLAVDGDMLYIGTEQNGVLRFPRDNR